MKPIGYVIRDYHLGIEIDMMKHMPHTALPVIIGATLNTIALVIEDELGTWNL